MNYTLQECTLPANVFCSDLKQAEGCSQVKLALQMHHQDRPKPVVKLILSFEFFSCEL